MTDAPEKIWARPIMGYEDRPHGPWALDNPFGNATSYLRSDLAEAQIAAAYEAALSAIANESPGNPEGSVGDEALYCAYVAVRALTPSSAKTALDALLQAERERCIQCASDWFIGFIEGPDMRVTFDELATAIRNLNEGEG